LMQASQSAEAGIRGLKTAADETGRELQKKVQEAQSLRDDLAYMIDRGGGVADRMESSLRARREEPAREPARLRPVEAPQPRPAEAPARREVKSGPTNFIQEMAARLAPGSLRVTARRPPGRSATCCARWPAAARSDDGVPPSPRAGGDRRRGRIARDQ